MTQTEPQTAAGLPRQHQTMLLSHRAMTQDLDRIARTAARLEHHYDREREGHLRAYTEKLLVSIEHHHIGEDTFLWPALAEAGADPEALALMTAEHGDLAQLLAELHTALAQPLDRPAAARGLAEAARATHTLLAEHAADEERELLGRLGPFLTDEVWTTYQQGMFRTAQEWAFGFIAPWLASVAGPAEAGGLPPAPNLADLLQDFRRQQQAAFGEFATA